MSTNEILLVITACVASAAWSALITAYYYTRRAKGQYNQGWNAGRRFALEHLHNTITR